MKIGGFIFGYCGLLFVGYDMELMCVECYLVVWDIVFKLGVNEELGVIVVWGS